MRFQVLTLFPELMEAIVGNGVVGQARSKGLIRVEVSNPREFTTDTHKTVDDRPFGGGDGMILLAEPLEKALIQSMSRAERDPWVVYMSPQGTKLDQEKVLELREKTDLILICGRYGGIDQRIINQFVDEEISVGDYILSGGELAAGIVIDSVSRQIPGVLGHESSAVSDSFSSGLQGLLEAPSFTRPRDYLGEQVPEILLTGHHKKIQQWRESLSILTTLLKRPDLILERQLEPRQLQELKKFWSELSHRDKEVLGLADLTLDDLELLDQYDLK